MNKSRIILFFILVLAFFLRVKFLDSSVIGWHGVKEAEYLSIAKGFIDSGDFLHRRVFFFSGFTDGPGFFELYPQMPILSFLAYFVFILFGEHLWLIRLFSVFFSLGSVLLVYLIVSKLSSKKLALLTSFIMAIIPLSVYYGRMIMPESSSLFFFLLSLFFFLKWSDSLNRAFLIVSALSFSLAVIFKYSLFPFLIVHLFFFPYSKYRINLKDITTVFFCFLSIIVVFSVYQFSVTGELQDESNVFQNINPFEMFSPAFWASNSYSFFNYFRQAFSIYSLFAVFGLFFVKNHSLFRLIFGFILSIPSYLFLVGSFYFVNNIYYLYPFIFPVAILSSVFLEKLFSLNKYAFFTVILISLVFVNHEINFFYNYLIPGQEIAGEFMKVHSSNSQRILLYGPSESVSVCYYAERRCGFIKSKDNLLTVINKFNVPFVYVVASRFDALKNSDVWSEIQNSYSIKQIGGIMSQNKLQPSYYILEKNFTNSNSKSSPVKQKTYYQYSGNYYWKRKPFDFHTITY